MKNNFKTTIISAVLMMAASAIMLPQITQADPAAGATKTDSKTGMEFVWIPKGCFTMGSEEGEKAERMPHKVCLKKGFWMGKYEVTQAQYERIMDNNPSKFKGDDRPVDNVSWNDARDFIEEMSYVSGHDVRLPSEAEWEYACKAGRNSKYCGPGGNADRLSWNDNNSGGKTHTVGGKRANGWGLYDMSGNVWEWVQDCYHKNYRGSPTDGSAWQEGGCGKRVLRGGSWYSTPHSLRSAARSRTAADDRDDNLGFRLVQD